MKCMKTHSLVPGNAYKLLISELETKGKGRVELEKEVGVGLQTWRSRAEKEPAEELTAHARDASSGLEDPTSQGPERRGRGRAGRGSPFQEPSQETSQDSQGSRDP